MPDSLDSPAPAGPAEAAGAPAGADAVAAAELFGPALPQVQKYADLLAGAGVDRGVVGPAEADRIWDRHLLNCAAIARLIPAKCSIVDLGSGAGLPGIVLALMLPGATVTLLEPLARRVEFLQECVTELGLDNVQVLRGRAEDLDGQLAADVVTARAVAPLDRLAGLCIGLARPGGKVLAIKGAGAEAELAKARVPLARLGVTDVRVVHEGAAGSAAAATVVMFVAPERKGAGRGGSQASSRSGTPGGRRGGRAGFGGGAPGGRQSRPNSRRGGG